MTTYRYDRGCIVLNIKGVEHYLYGFCIGTYDKRLREYVDVDYIEKLLYSLSVPESNQETTNALLWLNEFLESSYKNLYKTKIIDWTAEQRKWNSDNNNAIRRDVMTNHFRGDFKEQSDSSYAQRASEKREITNRRIAKSKKSKKLDNT